MRPENKEMRRVQWALALYIHHDTKARSLLYENVKFIPSMTEEVLHQFLSRVHKHLQKRDKIQQQSTLPLGKYAKEYPEVG
jgi:hypothetical protein